jgi:hypothetical protein
MYAIEAPPRGNGDTASTLAPAGGFSGMPEPGRGGDTDLNRLNTRVVTPESMIVAYMTKTEMCSGGLWTLVDTDEHPRAHRCHPSAMMASAIDRECIV